MTSAGTEPRSSPTLARNISLQSPDTRTRFIHPAWLAPALAALTFTICYLRAFLLPGTPMLFWGDQGGFATKGAQILSGQLPYRDFFEFLTPGTDLVYAALFRCFGVVAWLPNLVMAILAAITAWLMTYCALRIMRGLIVALPAILLTGFVLYGSLDATHHWFSTVLILGAASVLMESTSSPRIVAAATLIGLSACFTQTKGVAAAIGLGAFLIVQSLQEHHASSRLWQRAALFFSVSLAIFAAVNLPFILAIGPHPWTTWLDQVLIFPVRYFGTVSANNLHGTWPEFLTRHGTLKWLCFPFVYISVPLAYAAFFLRMRRAKVDPSPSDPSPQTWTRLLPIAIVGIAMLAVMIPALSMRRLSCASPPAMILLAWLLSRTQTWRKPAAITLAVLSSLAAAAQICAVQLRPGPKIVLQGTTYVVPEAINYDLYRWTANHTQPAQWFFGFSPMILPLQLRNAAPIEMFGPGEYSRPEQVTATIAALERTKTPLLILPHSVLTQSYGPDHLQPFRDYLQAHYRQAKLFANGFEAWERI